MPLAEAIDHIDSVAPRFLSLNGIGEPLLHPEWDRIVGHAVERHGASVGFATTGVHFRAQADRMCKSGLGLVKVSFHGAKPKTFARMASGRDLEVVEDGIRHLLSERSRLGRGPEVRLNYVVSEESFTELSEAVLVASRTGVSAVYFKGALIPAGRNSGLAGELDVQLLGEAVEDGLAVAQERGVATNLAHWRREVRRVGEGPRGLRAAPEGRCLIPWISVFIRLDGTVLPCCNCTFRPDEGKMGRIGRDGTFDEIWRNDRLAALRQEMVEGTYSLPICQHCPDPVTASQTGEAAANGLWPGLLAF